MKGTVLVIEDNEQNRYLARFLFERAGYQVIAAHDGHRGLQQALGCRPNVILLDIQLPTLNGYAVATALRDLPQLEGTPIIAVTSYAMAGDREKALASGCTGYLEKPIDPDTFVSEIEALMGRASESAA